MQVFCRDCLRAKLKVIQMKLTIRPLETKDRSVWERMFQAYAEFYKTSVKDEKLDEVWNWIFDLNNNFWCDIALGKSGNILGFTQYQLMHRTETLMNVNKAKAVLCDEQQDAVDGDDIDYQPFNVRRKKAQKTAQSSPAKE